MIADVPETVGCPCGNGYAERRPTAIRELVTQAGTPVKQVRRTIAYRHEGCPIGGHIVEQHGDVLRRAGPLFTAGPREVAQVVDAAEVPVRVATDGGEPS